MRVLLLSIVFILISHPSEAKDWQVPLDRFEGIDIGTGIVAEVLCGDEPRVIVNASERIFENLQIAVQASTLKIHLDHNWSQMFTHDHGSISATIYTSEPLLEIEGSTGSGIEIESCAVSADELNVRISTGATVNLAGETKLLELKVGTGGSFNSGRYRDDLKVQKASVRLSTGANAGLCAADQVTGRLSTGAEIVVSENTNAKVRLGTGAEIEYSSCW